MEESVLGTVSEEKLIELDKRVAKMAPDFDLARQMFVQVDIATLLGHTISDQDYASNTKCLDKEIGVAAYMAKMFRMGQLFEQERQKNSQ